MIEDMMVGLHHQFSGHEFEQAPGDGKRQETLVCCSPSGYKESDTTKWLNNNNEKTNKQKKHRSSVKTSFFKKYNTLDFTRTE